MRSTETVPSSDCVLELTPSLDEHGAAIGAGQNRQGRVTGSCMKHLITIDINENRDKVE